MVQIPNGSDIRPPLGTPSVPMVHGGHRGRQEANFTCNTSNPGDPEKGERSSLSGYWLGSPLIRACVLQPFLPPRDARVLRPAAAGSIQARRRTALPPTISPFAIDLPAPFAARLDARALRRSCARTPKSGQLVPAQHGSMARSARACCAGAAAKAPTQRVARRNRRRM